MEARFSLSGSIDKDLVITIVEQDEKEGNRTGARICQEARIRGETNYAKTIEGNG
ncbi:MAG: hypothetical protein R3B51_13640 [Thermodesulfobacteriota bacterium]